MTTSTQNQVGLISIQDIEKIYSPGIGRHWFDKETMRFFRTRLPQYGYEGPGGVYFVSSEQGFGFERAYSVRKLEGPGSIQTVGEFNSLTRSQANTLAKKMAAGKA